MASFLILQLEQLYDSIAWPLYKLYGHAFDAFKVMVQDPEAVFSKLVEVSIAPVGDVLSQNHLLMDWTHLLHHQVQSVCVRHGSDCTGMVVMCSRHPAGERRAAVGGADR